MFNLHLKAVLRRFVQLLTVKKIKHRMNGSIYLERYYLLKSPLLSVNIHHILQSDADEWLHNHPWKWAVSIIMFGGYTEERLQKDKAIMKKEYSFGSLIIIRANTFHRISSLLSKDVWTLFIHGPREKKWTFLDVKSERQYDRPQ